MRSKFPGYYSLEDDKIDEMWDKAIIVLDTNVLLDFYRVSPETQSDLLSLLDYFGEHQRLWIPYQVALEYHSNLYKVVSDQMTRYDDTLDILKKFLSSITQKRNHPFLNDNLINRSNNFIKDIGKYFESQKKKLKDSVVDSSLKGKIADIFQGHVGDSFTDDELKQIYIQGNTRYLKNIPPGFEDKKKGDSEKYNDLVVWNEVLRYAKAKSVSVIFVSSDTKKDWYLVAKGQTICPQPLLIKEFQDTTDQNILLYSLERFMSLAKERNVVNIQDDSIEELKDKEVDSRYVLKYYDYPEILKKIDLEKSEEAFDKFYNRYLQKYINKNKQQSEDVSDMGSTSSATITSDQNAVNNDSES